MIYLKFRAKIILRQLSDKSDKSASLYNRIYVNNVSSTKINAALGYMNFHEFIIN